MKLQQLPSLQNLIRQLQKVPYLASKNMYRVAMHLLERDKKSVELFCTAILEAKEKILPCVHCFNWTEGDEACAICLSGKRLQSVLCVVETWHDLQALERAGDFNGLYHVLGGALCPLEGIGPDELHITSLLKRLEDEGIQEVIFATNPTPEGEATSSYISSKIARKDITISRLASGVPIGSSLEYMDRVTISKALSGRRPY